MEIKRETVAIVAETEERISWWSWNGSGYRKGLKIDHFETTITKATHVREKRTLWDDKTITYSDWVTVGD